MFSITVIKKKDIIRYTFKVGLLVTTLIAFQKLIAKNTVTISNQADICNLVNNNNFFYCIEDSIGIIKQIDKNNTDIQKDTKNIPSITSIIFNQIKVANFIKKTKDENKTTQEIDNKEEVKEESDKIEQPKDNVTTQIIESNVPNKFTNSYNNVEIKNETNYFLDDEILKPNIEIDKKNILIFHTHTCESYTASPQYNYEPTGTYRTTDLNYSVVRVGDELTKQLKSYGSDVIHDTTYHDWPAYSGSYGRSLETVKNILNDNKNIDIVIDLHRDAIGDYSYAPTVKIGEERAARLMFVIGTDGGGLEHPNWNQNLKFAVKVQEKANELFPGLFKPIILRNSRYNQHLTKAACIIEVGATGNTMEECLNSMKYLAKAINEI